MVGTLIAYCGDCGLLVASAIPPYLYSNCLGYSYIPSRLFANSLLYSSLTMSFNKSMFDFSRPPFDSSAERLNALLPRILHCLTVENEVEFIFHFLGAEIAYSLFPAYT